ncbi:glycosyltransferase [Microbacterium paludicola]|uniref:glycosyltransferase n=1 Tax=Microbacterium paludicola TaxID=300019 RepID=UPI001C92BBE1|nr:glycosyltransferase [Microbacterium paludicola]
MAVSTGAAPAVAALPMAKRRGIDTVYIESVSRVHGPSLSGRILQVLRAARLFTQHPRWANSRWKPHRSVFETFRRTERAGSERPSLFVTLGTIEGFRFDSMIDAVLATGLADERTVWQLGYSTGRKDLPGKVFEQVSAADFDSYASAADVVVSHAGVGSLLGLLDLGIAPVLVVRRKARQEHVDDHQAQIAELADSRGVAVSVEVEDLDAEVLRRASCYGVEDVRSLGGNVS